MSTDRQQRAEMDRLLRVALKADAPVSHEACPEAGVIAAYAEGGLTASERSALDPHLATCARCQSILAVMVRDVMADADLQPSRVAAWRAWFTMPRFRWLVPASAAAIVMILYVAVTPEPPSEEAASPASATASATAPAQAPEGMMAKLSEQDVSPTPAESPASLPTRAKRPQAESTRPADAESPAAPATMAGRKDETALSVLASRDTSTSISGSGALQLAVPPARPTLALAEPAPQPWPAAVSAAPAPSESAVAPALQKSTLAEAILQSDSVGASARIAVANRAVRVEDDEKGRVSPGVGGTETRTTRDAGAGSHAMPASAPGKGGSATGKRIVTVEVDIAATAHDVESLWKEAEFVVRARAVAQYPAVLGRQRIAPDTEAVEPIVSTDFEVVEVFKRTADVNPAPRFVMGQIGSTAEDEATIYRVPDENWVRIASGSDYILFLTRSRHPAMPNVMTSFAGPWGIHRLRGDFVEVGNGGASVTQLSTTKLLAQLRQLAGTTRR